MDGRGDGGFGKCADGVGGGQGTALRVLRDVDQDAAGRTFCDDAFTGDEIRVFGGYTAGDDFREGAQLFVGVNGFDGNKDVETGGAGSFEKTFELERFEPFMQRFGDGDDDVELGAIGGIEVEEKIVRMVEIGNRAGPGIVVDAAEAGEKQERSEVIGGGVVNFFAAFFRVDGNGLEPIGETFA